MRAWRQPLAGVGRLEVEAAIRASVATLIPLLVLLALDRLDLAIYACFGAFTALYGRSEPYAVRFPTLLVAGVSLGATATAGVLLSALQAPVWVVGIVLVVIVAVAIALSETMSWIPRGAIFFVFVLLGLESVPVEPERIHEPLLVTASAIALSIAIGMSGWLIRRNPPEWLRAKLTVLDRRPVRRLSPVRTRTYWYLAVVNVVGILAAWLLGLASGIGHPYWAAVTVAAVMPTLGSLTQYRRMIQRVVGTALGVLVAAALFGWTPPAGVMIGMIAVCSFAAELLVARHYGVALLAITPLAIGASNLGRGRPWLPLLFERVTETVIGAAVALVIIVVARAVVRREPRMK